MQPRLAKQKSRLSDSFVNESRSCLGLGRGGILIIGYWSTWDDRSGVTLCRNGRSVYRSFGGSVARNGLLYGSNTAVRHYGWLGYGLIVGHWLLGSLILLIHDYLLS
jgi:hypothetical protein